MYVSPRQLNAIISATNTILEALGIADTKAREGMGLSAWRASDDTGMSSLYMASVIWGGGDKYAEPSDPDDFGRCYRLILAVPGTRERLHMMAEKSAYWKLLYQHWVELEKHYEYQLNDKETNRKKKKYPCWDMMQALQAEAQEKGKDKA